MAVTSSTPGNHNPTAAVTATCSRLDCAFRDGSSDPDGTITRREWSFGDGATSLAAGAELAHTFGAGGVYRIILTVTDDAGGTGQAVQEVEAGVVLQATGYRIKGRHSLDLNWRGAESARVSLYLNGAAAATVANTGSHVLNLSTRGQKMYSVRVCEAGATTMCSLDVAISM